MGRNFIKRLVARVTRKDNSFVPMAVLDVEDELEDIPPEILKVMEVERLTEIVKGMSDDELAIVADNIPIQLCFDRIQKELQQKDELIKSIREIYSVFNEGEA